MQLETYHTVIFILKGQFTQEMKILLFQMYIKQRYIYFVEHENSTLKNFYT